MKILLINFQRTGDIFQSFQIIFALKRKYPESKISYLTNSVHAGALDIAASYLDKVYSADYMFIFDNMYGKKLVKNFLYLKNLTENIKKENFDLIVNLNFSKLSAIFTSILKGKIKEGAILLNSHFITIENKVLNVLYENMESPDFTTNIVEVYLKALNLNYAKPLLFPPEKREKIEKIILHPGASREEKKWGIENFVNLSVLLKKEIIITGSIRERDENARLEERLTEKNIKVTNLTGKTDLKGLTELFREVDLIISGDTSIVHIAALTPVKSITVFLGNAYHFHTYPYCNGKIIIFPNISCYPCAADFNCKHMTCKAKITPELVFKAVQGEKENNIAETFLTNDGFVSI